MAIIENRVTEIGDVLYIKAEVPIIGLLTLIDFVDTVGGETLTRLFYKEFRYSKDGINFYPWQELTDLNVSAIQVNPSDTFIVEYRYKRIGTDPSDELTFSDVTLRGDYEQLSCGTSYQTSIFAQFFSCSDIEVLAWAINVLEKCYKKGIIPTYIERGKDFDKDRDYIDFWRTFTTFFAYIVVYARKFQNFSQVKELLLSYLTQRGMFVCADDTEMQELIYLKENFYREISKRGTLSMSREKGNRIVIRKILGDEEVVNGDFYAPGAIYIFGTNTVFNDISGGKYDFTDIKYSANSAFKTGNILQVGNKYRLSFYYKNNSSSNLLQFYLMNGNSIVSTLKILDSIVTEEIVTVDFEVTSGDNISWGYTGFPGTEMYMTDFSVKELTEEEVILESPVDGEVLRMICKGEFDEFIFTLVDSRYQGWSLNNCSPLWRGNIAQKHLNKSWEDTQDFKDLSLVPTFGNVSLETDGNKQVIKLLGDTASERNGIGGDYLDLNSIDLSKAIIVSPKISYRISFQIRQPIAQTENFTFGVLGFDKDNNQILFKTITTASLTNFFFQRKKLNKGNTYYFVEGIIYHFEQNLLSLVDGTCNIGFGNDLQFLNANVCKILPFITSDTPSSQASDGSLFIWNLKIVPYETSYSTGVIQMNNLVKMWYKNNNVSLQNEEVEAEIKHFMINYSSPFKAIEVNDPKPVYRFPSFDYAVVRYIWGDGGRDLDTRTAIIDTLPLIDGDDIGWARGNTIGPGPTPNYYLEFGGDNTGEVGTEGVLINFNKIIQDNPSLEEIKVRLRAFWYGSLVTGDIIVQLVTYSGGVMQRQGTDFINIGGTEVSNISKPVNIQTNVSENVDGSEAGVITYFSNTKTAILV